MLSCGEKPLNVPQWAFRCLVSSCFHSSLTQQTGTRESAGARWWAALTQDYLAVVPCLHTWCAFPSKLSNPWKPFNVVLFLDFTHSDAIYLARHLLNTIIWQCFHNIGGWLEVRWVPWAQSFPRFSFHGQSTIILKEREKRIIQSIINVVTLRYW